MKNRSEILIEGCATSYRVAKHMEAAGADVIEICENLTEGGTTPSIGTVTRLSSELAIPLYVLIRPRGGDFVYSSGELEIMKTDIAHCKEAGATGISIGLLTPDLRIDEEKAAELIALARPMQVSFNTAFDYTTDLFASLETLCSLKVNRVLTSGGFGCASDNLSVLRELTKLASGRISLVICGGMNADNYEYVARQAGVSMVHGAGIL